jgi:hypothetical protein
MGATSAQLITKADRANRSRALLHLLQQLQLFDFRGITTGGESWFRYEYESDSMFAPSADMVLPRLRAGFQVKKKLITICFPATRLIVLNSLPQGQSFTQNYSISEIVPAFTKEKPRFRRHHENRKKDIEIKIEKQLKIKKKRK